LLNIRPKFKSKFEVRTDGQIRRSRRSYSYETERIPYVLASHYTPDFIITTPTGKLYIECKGYFRADDKRKLKAVKRQHPELDLRLLFYREVKQYIKWCNKNGFKYAIGKIPKDWLAGL